MIETGGVTMSKGDDLWKVRTSILRRLYEEGAISDGTGMEGVKSRGKVTSRH